MIFFIILLVVALIGLIIIFSRHYISIKNFSDKELLSRFGETVPFWNDFYDFFVVPAARVHQEKVRPATYKEIEKLARRFRIIVLRVECLLLRFSEYIKGKRTMPCNGNGHKSHYWEQLNNCKNNITNSTDSDSSSA